MAAGDREACARFYDRYAPLVFPLILRVVRDRSDAADVLQDVFWEAWQGAAGYDPGRGSPEAWMITRARTRAIDRVRAVRRRSATFVPPVDEGLASAPPEAGGDAAERAEDRGVIQSALQALPPAAARGHRARVLCGADADGDRRSHPAAARHRQDADPARARAAS